MTKEIKINLEIITQEIDDLNDQKARLKFELNNIEKELEKRELQLMALLNQMKVNEMNYGIYSWGIKKVSRTALDQKMLKELYPEQYNACYIPKVSEKFEFKINK